MIPNVVEIIGRHILFDKTILNGIKHPGSIKILNNNTYIEHDVKTAIIPNNIIEIYVYEFSICSSLTDITIPNVVIEIGEFISF